MSMDRIDHYRLLDVIGTGGFATVYRAEDERFGTSVAIKLLAENHSFVPCLLYTSPSPRDLSTSRMPSSA